MENLAGQTLTGRYRVLEVLGAGGMGVVYRARDERLERDVAIKVLAPGVLDDERVRKRFRKEALALSRLNHPNIAAVYDFVNEGGHDYIVMELVPGPTLDAKLAGGPLPQKEVLALGKQLAEALAAAHQEGVIHRDLKPANLRFASLHGADPRIKVLDFGLAEVQTGPNAQLTTASFRSDSSVSGTLPYMAPEQLRGDPPDVRSDVYAAGAVLYEMATGKRAFPQGGYVIVDAILNQPPSPPTQWNAQVSPGLENAILKALDKNPGFRYQTARDLLAELERLTASNTVSVARGAPRAPRPRRRALILGTLLTLVVLVGAAEILLRSFGRPSQYAQEQKSGGPQTPRSEEAAQTGSPPPAGQQGAPMGIPPVPIPPVAVAPDVVSQAMRAEKERARNAARSENVEGAEGRALGFIGSVTGIAGAYHDKNGDYPQTLAVLLQWGRDHHVGGKYATDAALQCMVDPCIVGNYSWHYARPTPQSYTLGARPIAYPYTGKRSFYADQTSAIHATSEDRAATARDPEAR